MCSVFFFIIFLQASFPAGLLLRILAAVSFPPIYHLRWITLKMSVQLYSFSKNKYLSINAMLARHQLIEDI